MDSNQHLIASKANVIIAILQNHKMVVEIGVTPTSYRLSNGSFIVKLLDHKMVVNTGYDPVINDYRSFVLPLN